MAKIWDADAIMELIPTTIATRDFQEMHALSQDKGANVSYPDLVYQVMTAKNPEQSLNDLKKELDPDIVARNQEIANDMIREEMYQKLLEGLQQSKEKALQSDMAMRYFTGNLYDKEIVKTATDMKIIAETSQDPNLIDLAKTAISKTGIDYDKINTTDVPVTSSGTIANSQAKSSNSITTEKLQELLKDTEVLLKN